MKTRFVERTLDSLADRASRALYAEDLAHSAGLLQGLDPRFKLGGLFALIMATAVSRHLEAILGLFVVALVLAIFSHVPLGSVGKRIWIPALIFTGAITFPAIFVTPGKVLCRIPLLHWPVSLQGLTAATFLVSRVETAATFACLLALCTPWNNVLKALRAFKVPPLVVAILGVTYRYVLLFLKSAHEMFESRQSRMVGRLDARGRRQLVAATAGVLISRSFQLSEDVYLAMLSRGFRGEVHALDEFRARRRDWLALAVVAGMIAAAYWFGR